MPPEQAEGASSAASEELPKDAAAQAAEALEAQPDANAAESSAAGEKDANDRPSLLDIVKNVVEPKAATAEDPSDPAGDQETKPEGEAEAAAAAKADAEGDETDVPFHEHPRWKAVLRERDELKPDAEQYRGIMGFMDHHGLSGEEVSEGFEVMARLKSGDPAQLREALDWFEPRVQSLRESLGMVLPSDLQQKVDDGVLDADVAKELAETRAASALRERQDEVRSDATAELAQTEKLRETAQAVGTAVSGWETEIRRTDPDYAKKAELVESALIALVAREGTPGTPEAAVALTVKAYEQVNRSLKAVIPKRGAVDTTTPAGSSARATAVPTTLRGAIEAAVAA